MVKTNIKAAPVDVPQIATDVSPKSPLTPEQARLKLINFLNEIGYALRPIPKFIARDDGTFSTVVEVELIEVKK